MQISPTYGPDPQSFGGQQLASKPSKGADTGARDGAPGCVRVPSQYAAYVRQAAGAEDIDKAAVAEAKQLLDSGQLDSPDAARRAAESILTLGI